MKAKNWPLYQLRWGLGQVLALIALGGAIRLEVSGTWLLSGAAILIATMTLQPRWTGRFQPILVRYFPRVLLVGILFDFVLSGGDFYPPIVRALAFLLTYRALEFRMPRQDRQLVLLSLFLVLLTGVLSESFGLAMQLLLFVPIAMALLTVVVIEEDRGTVVHRWEDVWGDFSWYRWGRIMRRRIDLRMSFLMAALYSGFVVMSLLVFWSLPRFEYGQQLPFPKLSGGSSLTGFSDIVLFGSVVDIQQDHRVAMRVDVPRDAVVSVPYWRMAVLDEYFGRGFRQSESAREANEAFNDIMIRGGGPLEGEDRGTWTHYLEGGISHYLPLAGRFEELSFTSRRNLQINRAVSTAGLAKTSTNLLVFRTNGIEQDRVTSAVIADVPLATRGASENRREPPPYPSYPWTTLQVPEDVLVKGFLADAVEQIGADLSGDPSVEQFAREATRWLQGGRGYSLSAQLGEEGDPLVSWMQSGEGGHCELFAGSLVLLARQAAIPARLVTGFYGGTWNGFEDYLMVRNSNAHAWVELYDSGRGWIRWDPTPGELTRAASGAEARGPAAEGLEERSLAAYLDSLRVIWYRRIVNFDHRDQRALMASLNEHARSLLEQAKSTLQGWSSSLADLGGRIRDEWSQYIAEGSLLAAAAAGVFWILRNFRWKIRRTTGEIAVRRGAQRRLRKLDKLPGVPPETVASLLHLRYGSPREWTDPRGAFKSADSALWKSRRATRPAASPASPPRRQR